MTSIVSEESTGKIVRAVARKDSLKSKINLENLVYDAFKKAIPATCNGCGEEIHISPLGNKIACECGHRNLPGRLTSAKPTVRIQDDNPDASYTTHNKITWSCESCGAAGFEWVRKGKKIYKCPNPKCEGENRPWVFKQHITDPKGEYDTIWGDKNSLHKKTRKRPSPPRKTAECFACGGKTFYLLKYPKKCIHCDRPMYKDKILSDETIQKGQEHANNGAEH